LKVRICTENPNFLQIYEATDKELTQIEYSFKPFVDNYRFNPKYKRGIWDGRISFYSKHKRLIPIGLWNQLCVVAKEFDFECFIEDIDEIVDQNFIFEEFEEWIRDFFKDHPLYCIGGEKEVRDYQIKSAFNILQFRLSTSEIATSAGKTLIMFIVFAYLFSTNKIKNYLIIVPTTSLILQGMEDFEEYNNGKLKFDILPVHAGTKKDRTGYEIIFGTFQSLTKQETEWFADIDVICVDECHTAQNQSIRDIISKCPGLKYRYGLSGTAKKHPNSANHYTLQAYLGPYVNDISAKFLIDNKFATQVFVKVVRMNYLEDDIKKKLQELRYKRHEIEGTKLLNIEKKLVIDNRKRFLYVTDFISKATKNSLVLFADIKYGYGRKIYDWLRQNTDKTVYYIDGDTSTKNRDLYFSEMEEGNNKILVASFLTCSQGISINNLHNLFLVESYKSDKIIRQSIGRGMRKQKNKERTTIIDFCDDFSMKTQGYLRKHSEERIQTYKEQGFPFKIFEVNY